MKRFNKKGFEFITNWVVLFFVAILFLSFALSFIIINQWVNYVIIIFTGLVLGRFIYMSKLGNKLPYFILSFAFISGYLAGHKAGNWVIMAILFVGILMATNRLSKLVE